MDSSGKKRVLIFIVAYNAERKIEKVIERIPQSLAEYDTQILIIDDSSQDRTFELARRFEGAPFPMTVLFNPVNQGYGGNQKIGFHYAMRRRVSISSRWCTGTGSTRPNACRSCCSRLSTAKRTLSSARA